MKSHSRSSTNCELEYSPDAIRFLKNRVNYKLRTIALYNRSCVFRAEDMRQISTLQSWTRNKVLSFVYRLNLNKMSRRKRMWWVIENETTDDFQSWNGGEVWSSCVFTTASNHSYFPWYRSISNTGAKTLTNTKDSNFKTQKFRFWFITDHTITQIRGRLLTSLAFVSFKVERWRHGSNDTLSIGLWCGGTHCSDELGGID